MNAGPGAYAVLSAVVFAIGLFGVITRSTTHGVLLAIPLLFGAPVIALLGVSQGGGPQAAGGALALFGVVAAVSVVATGIGLALLVRRRVGSSDVDDLIELEE